MTIDRVPFTRPYVSGDARLRRRWPFYFLGMYAFAYWPVRFELRCMDGHEPVLVAAIGVVGLGLHLLGHSRARRFSVAPDDDAHSDWPDLAVLNIGAISRPMPAGRPG
jgi:hypothetical protein